MCSRLLANQDAKDNALTAPRWRFRNRRQRAAYGPFLVFALPDFLPVFDVLCFE